MIMKIDGVTVITQCLIWALSVNGFTGLPRGLSQCARMVTG
jgi:hypothetical protein